MRRILCRDLNPGKMLLSKNGYGKLYDFGIAKFTSGISFTVVGAEVYWAPEMVNLQGHSKGLDWWSLGISLVELLTSRVPWDIHEELDSEKLMAAIKSKRLETYKDASNPNVTDEAADLIQNLCKDRDTERLPCLPDGMTKLKEHPFFAGKDWDELAKGSAAAPITVKSFDLKTHQFRRDARPEADLVRDAIRVKFEPFEINEF
jgi:serine/threonine protein kinase